MTTGATAHLADRLANICARQGVNVPAARIRGFLGDVEGAVKAIDHSLTSLASDLDAPHGHPVRAAAHHALHVAGKRVRPLCIALAARAAFTGEGELPPAAGHTLRELGVAVELVHSATLLHDDVVDAADLRRGQPTARILFGNAASIFGGDWLLVEALERVRRAGPSGALEDLLAVVKEMLDAEGLQLAHRGTLTLPRELYAHIAEGKTASLFRWAFRVGARAAGADAGVVLRLERFGGAMGLAFQLVDDVLDMASDPESTGKALWKDLDEGTLGYPLLLVFEQRPDLREQALAVAAGGEATTRGELIQAIHEAAVTTGAVRRTRALADAYTDGGLKELEGLPASPARDALAEVVTSLARRGG